MMEVGVLYTNGARERKSEEKESNSMAFKFALKHTLRSSANGKRKGFCL